MLHDRTKEQLKQARQKNQVDNLVACLTCHLPQSKYIGGAMNTHLPFHGNEEKDCDLMDTVVDVITAVCATPDIYQDLVSRSSGNVLEWLLSPVSFSPSNPIDPSKQLLKLHYIIPSVAAVSGSPPLSVQTLFNQPWFEEWRIERTSEIEPVRNALAPTIRPAPIVNTTPIDPRAQAAYYNIFRP